MTIDDLLNNLHADKLATIDEQLRAVERELNTRRLVSAEIMVTLFDQLRTINEHILRLQPEHAYAPDRLRTVREPLEREARQLARDIREELRNRWNDQQKLGTERRQLQREHHEQAQRYERHTGQYDG